MPLYQSCETVETLNGPQMRMQYGAVRSGFQYGGAFWYIFDGKQTLSTAVSYFHLTLERGKVFFHYFADPAVDAVLVSSDAYSSTLHPHHEHISRMLAYYCSCLSSLGHCHSRNCATLYFLFCFSPLFLFGPEYR